MDDRNQVLIDALKRFCATRLVDGSVPSIVAALIDRLGFLCRSAEWVAPPAFTWEAPARIDFNHSERL